ncbi:MAG: DUF2752 domain-containing protein [Ignavibacteriales bacterium]|nr:MAG: DUF2752 domain-containing protein [Ignavibacteriales bacterium]
MKARLIYRSINLEALLWLFALTFLAFYSPSTENHFTFCLFNNLGIGFCPGCGLGHSISHLFRFEIYESFTSHPLGIPALLILVYRIVQLTKDQIINNQNKIIPN